MNHRPLVHSSVSWCVNLDLCTTTSNRSPPLQTTLFIGPWPREHTERFYVQVDAEVLGFEHRLPLVYTGGTSERKKVAVNRGNPDFPVPALQLSRCSGKRCHDALFRWKVPDRDPTGLYLRRAIRDMHPSRWPQSARRQLRYSLQEGRLNDAGEVLSLRSGSSHRMAPKLIVAVKREKKRTDLVQRHSPLSFP